MSEDVSLIAQLNLKTNSLPVKRGILLTQFSKYYKIQNIKKYNKTSASEMLSHTNRALNVWRYRYTILKLWNY